MSKQDNMMLKIEFLKKMLGPVVVDALDDNDITEIMANPDGSVWFESRTRGMVRAGEIGEFESQNFLFQLANLKDFYLNYEQPFIETLLPFNRERIEGTIAPITARASFVIRKPAKHVYPLESYVQQAILTDKQADFICQAIVDRQNIVVSGGPGTGKTTLSNAVIKKMAELCADHRVLILEDTAEIQCQMPNVMQMLTTHSVNMTKLLLIAMRSRPDRILVGEVRDRAALDLLKTWNTGCPGGIATIHANSTESTVLRLLSLAQEAGVPPPIELVRETVNVLINIVRDPTHPAGRVVKGISRISDFQNDTFLFEQIT